MLIIVGLFIGVGGTYYFISSQLSGKMFLVRESGLGFEETVAAIQDGAQNAGWQVSHIYDIQKSLAADSLYIKRLKVLSLCKKKFAYAILSDNENKKISGIMPCRIAVFEDQQGKVMVSQINVGMMSMFYGGVVEDVMNKVSLEQEAFLKPMLK